MTLINSIKNLYNSEDLNGDIFTLPLKAYHGFFAQKIDDHSGLKKLAWRIGNIITGILFYPLFGLLAGFGLLVKLTGISNLKKDNELRKSVIHHITTDLKKNIYHSKDLNEGIVGSSYNTQDIKEFKVKRVNAGQVCQEINEEIDLLTSQFKKVYLSIHGEINPQDSNSEITITLRIVKAI